MTDKLEQFGIKDSERSRCEIWTRVIRLRYNGLLQRGNIGVN